MLSSTWWCVDGLHLKLILSILKGTDWIWPKALNQFSISNILVSFFSLFFSFFFSFSRITLQFFWKNPRVRVGMWSFRHGHSQLGIELQPVLTGLSPTKLFKLSLYSHRPEGLGSLPLMALIKTCPLFITVKHLSIHCTYWLICPSNEKISFFLFFSKVTHIEKIFLDKLI